MKKSFTLLGLLFLIFVGTTLGAVSNSSQAGHAPACIDLQATKSTSLRRLNKDRFLYRWTPVRNAKNYAVVIDNSTDGFVDPCEGGSCTCSTKNPADICKDNVRASSYQITLTPGQAFKFMVYPINACGKWGLKSDETLIFN